MCSVMIVKIAVERSIDAVVDIIHHIMKIAVAVYVTFRMNARDQCVGGRDKKSARFSNDCNVCRCKMQVQAAINDRCDLFKRNPDIYKY